jgi:hypothetical protein
MQSLIVPFAIKMSVKIFFSTIKNTPLSILVYFQYFYRYLTLK